jgi:hypothetical protein
MMKIPPMAALLVLGALNATSAVADESDAEIAKKLNNPVASLISVPFQANWDFKMGPQDHGTQFKLNFQPVVPVHLNEHWNLIVRTIVPYISQEDVFPLDRHQDGLGDTTQSFFLSPKDPVGGWIVGVGPDFLYPTATETLLGNGKWGVGPTFVVLRQDGGWTYGVLANQIWSFAGDEHRRSVNSAFVQPFLTYTTKTHTTFGVNSESTYDWNTSQWTVPVNLFATQLVRIGKLPVQFQVGGRYYADGPSGAPEWGLRFTVTPVFPESHAAPAHAKGNAK